MSYAGRSRCPTNPPPIARCLPRVRHAGDGVGGSRDAGRSCRSPRHRLVPFLRLARRAARACPVARRCLLGHDPAVVHVHGGRVDALLVRQSHREGRDLDADVRPRPATLVDPDRAGGLPCVERQPRNALLVHQRARADRAGLLVRVPAAGPEAGRPARRRRRDPGVRTGCSSPPFRWPMPGSRSLSSASRTRRSG